MYRDYDTTFFKNINNPWNKDGDIAIREICQVYKIQGKVLDLGFGVGRHVKEFTKLGCNVTCTDTSKLGFQRLSKYNDSNKLNINIYNQDMFKFIIKNKYDIIFSYMALQYAKNKTQFSNTIKNIKNHTKKGGINYIRVPIKGMTLDFPYLIDNLSELKNYYKTWEILSQKEEIVRNLNNTKSCYALIIAKNN